MKTLFSKWNSISLIKRIIAGLILGVILAVAVPKAQAISILGDLFVGALKAIAPVLIFFLVIGSLCRAKTGKGSMKIVILLYLLGTFLASVVSVIVSFIFPLSITLTDAVTDNAPPEGILQVLQDLIMKIVDNPVAALMNANYIGILAWAIIIGIALRMAAESTKITIVDISDALTKVVRGIISLAPFGILGLVYTAVTSSGIAIFTEYGKLIVLLVGSMLAVALILNPLIVFFCIRKNPYPLVFKCIKESGITAFFTRSSAANIPVNMQLCKSLDLDEDNYSVSIPLGATINMEGAAITINIMTLCGSKHSGNRCGLPYRYRAEHYRSDLRMRRFRRCRRFSAPDSSRLQFVQHLQRCGHAGRRRRLHHRSHPGFHGDSAQFLYRRAFHSSGGIQTVAKEGREIVINKKL